MDQIQETETTEVLNKKEEPTALQDAMITTEYVGNEQKNNDGVVYQILYQPHPNQCYSQPRLGHDLQTSRNDSVRIPVTCGTAVGKMHLDLFLCPGIHQPCIEFFFSDGEFLTPKQFTILGDKEKQKDWKASIRIGKSSLRAHMESATIEFHDHPTQCSGKCQSRNYVNTPLMREEVMMIRRQQRNVDKMHLRRELGETVAEVDSETTENVEEGDETGQKKMRLGTSQERERRGRGRPRGSGNKKPKKEIARDYFYNNNYPQNTMQTNNIEVERPDNGCSPYFDIMQCLQYEPQQFWSQMQNAGVLSHFCDDIIVSAINLKHMALAPEPISDRTALMLSKSIFALNIQKTVVNRVQDIERCYAEDRKRCENSIAERMNENGLETNENNVLTLDDVINEDTSQTNGSIEIELPLSEKKEVDKIDDSRLENIVMKEEFALDTPFNSISDESIQTAVEF